MNKLSKIFQEAFTNQTVNALEECIKEKLDRDELEKLQTYIDTRFKTFKPKVQQKKRAEETAAGTKKQLIKNCHCISCDRPVDIPIDGEG